MAKKRTEEEWMLLIKEFKNSKLKFIVWCRNKGISKSSIYPYLKKSRIKEPIEPEWVEITMPKITDSSSITLKIGDITLDLKNGLNRELLSDVLGVVLSLC